ncbi:MAG: TIGR03619 family F420-dependent LLM class oxidoreductase [Natronomonas sp.]
MARDLEFGAFLVTFGTDVTPDSFARAAREAERVGFDAVCVGDHIALPANIPETYPFSKSGRSPFDIGQNVYEAFQVLSFIAAETDELALATNTTIVPYRHPVELVRHVLTLDSLSNGRFELGAAPGWLSTEFDVLDVPFEDRGPLTDEFLAIFDRALGESEFGFDGTYHDFERIGFYPRPVDDGPTVWIGGDSGAAIRRVAEFGDGWTIFPESPAAVTDGLERIQRAWADFERAGDPDVSVALPRLEFGMEDGSPMGDEAELVEHLAEYADAGATRIYIFPQEMAATSADQAALFEYFADEIAPLI